MSDDAQRKWDERYAGERYIYGLDPAPFLVEHRGELPAGGRALDIAAGEGQNAVYLASEGFEVEAIDISLVGLRKAQKLAADRGVSLNTHLCDLERTPLPEGPYDVIVCIHYKQRELADPITASLAPGGLLVVEIATTENLKLHRHPSRRFCVEPSELVQWFPELHVLRYREGVFDGHAVAQLLAQKPSES